MKSRDFSHSPAECPECSGESEGASAPEPDRCVTRPARGPFSLGNPQAYRRWRERKLARYPVDADELVVEIRDPARLRPAEVDAIVERLRKANMAIYVLDDAATLSRRGIGGFARQLGLRTLDRNPQAGCDGIAAIRATGEQGQRGYVPYTDRALSWHTDGYYNAPDRRVHGVIMHCVSPAADGGASHLYDPELIYIALRDENPDYIAALMAPDVMTIPPNVHDGCVLRPARAGPVFTTDAHARTLHTRFTARKRHVAWKGDATTREAVDYLHWWLREPVPRAFRLTLRAGQGIVCNNVLHARTRFRDEPSSARTRLVWRARYRERVSGT